MKKRPLVRSFYGHAYERSSRDKVKNGPTTSTSECVNIILLFSSQSFSDQFLIVHCDFTTRSQIWERKQQLLFQTNLNFMRSVTAVVKISVSETQ